MYRQLRGPLLFLIGLLYACGPSDTNVVDSATDVAGISAQLDSIYTVFTRAYAEADVDLLMDSVYARDGFYLPPNSPILEGQEEFRSQFESFLGPIAEAGEPGPAISFDIRDRAIDGDFAYDIGIYTIRRSEASADAPGSSGKFIVIWKRDASGAWRIHADGFSALPAERSDE